MSKENSPQPAEAQMSTGSSSPSSQAPDSKTASNNEARERPVRQQLKNTKIGNPDESAEQIDIDEEDITESKKSAGDRDASSSGSRLNKRLSRKRSYDVVGDEETGRDDETAHKHSRKRSRSSEVDRASSRPAPHAEVEGKGDDAGNDPSSSQGQIIAEHHRPRTPVAMEKESKDQDAAPLTSPPKKQRTQDESIGDRVMMDPESASGKLQREVLSDTHGPNGAEAKLHAIKPSSEASQSEKASQGRCT